MNRPVNLRRKLSEQSLNYGHSSQLEEVFNDLVQVSGFCGAY